jgi:hypothetical protein
MTTEDIMTKTPALTTGEEGVDDETGEEHDRSWNNMPGFMSFIGSLDDNDHDAISGAILDIHGFLFDNRKKENAEQSMEDTSEICLALFDTINQPVARIGATAGSYIQGLCDLGVKNAKFFAQGVYTQETHDDLSKKVKQCKMLVHYAKVSSEAMKITEEILFSGGNQMHQSYSQHALRMESDKEVAGDKEAVIGFMLFQYYHYNLRRRHGHCYEEIKMDGHSTHAWKPKMTIRQSIYYFCQKDTRPDMWRRITMGKTVIDHVQNYLEECNDVEFPTLEPDRHVFSFPNGIYITDDDRFYPYVPDPARPSLCSKKLPRSLVACNYIDSTDLSRERQRRDSTKNERVTEACTSVKSFKAECKRIWGASGEPYEYDESVKRSLLSGLDEQGDVPAVDRVITVGCTMCTESDMVKDQSSGLVVSFKTTIGRFLMGKGCPHCANFKAFEQFSERNVESGNWFDIPTPNFDKIMSYQNFSPQVQRWVFVFLGRMFYWIGERDKWEVIPFFKGRAGTGKSSILRVLNGIYDTLDIGLLGNNIEKTFGLSALYDKLIYVCYEVKSDFGLGCAEFQSMISGEPVSVPIKGKTAIRVEWEIAGALAGNEIPGWLDASGSLARRIVIFEFNIPVKDKDADMSLASKISKERPRLILKFNRGYMASTSNSDVSKKSVWDMVPKELLEFKKNFTKEANVVEGFLSEKGFVFGNDHHMPYDEFKDALSAYCKSSGHSHVIINRDLIVQPLENYGAKIGASIESLTYQGVRKNAIFIRGIDMPSGDTSSQMNGGGGSGFSLAGKKRPRTDMSKVVFEDDD